MVDEVALSHISLRMFQLSPVSIIPPLLHTHIQSTLYQKKMRSSEGTFESSDALSECSRISSACRTTRYVKGFLPFNHIAFTHVPTDKETSKLFQYSMFGISVSALCLQNLCLYFGEEISEFRLRCGSFVPQKLKFIF
jgi:hypothetical protein